MISVRRLQPGDDLAAVLALCKDFFAEYEGHHEEFFQTDDPSNADISARFVQSMESDTNATIIALIDDVIIGYASLVVKDQPSFYKIKKVAGAIISAGWYCPAKIIGIKIKLADPTTKLIPGLNIKLISRTSLVALAITSPTGRRL